MLFCFFPSILALTLPFPANQQNHNWVVLHKLLHNGIMIPLCYNLCNPTKSWLCCVTTYATQRNRDFVWPENQKQIGVTIPLCNIHNRIMILLCCQKWKKKTWERRDTWGKEGIERNKKERKRVKEEGRGGVGANTKGKEQKSILVKVRRL